MWEPTMHKRFGHGKRVCGCVRCSPSIYRVERKRYTPLYRKVAVAYRYALVVVVGRERRKERWL